MRQITNETSSRRDSAMRWLGPTVIAVLLAGCAGAPATVESNEDMLAAAGFRVLGGGSSGYAAAQQQLPPHKFAQHTVDGILTYYYFDPTVCGCLYYGSQQNWDAYRQEAAEKLHLQAENLLVRANTPYTGQGGF
jgi:hypothetical protein